MFEDNVDFDLDDNIISSSFSTSQTNTPTFALPETSAAFKKGRYNGSESIKGVSVSVPKRTFPKEHLESSLSTVELSKNVVVPVLSHLDTGRPKEESNRDFLNPLQTVRAIKRKFPEPAGVLTEDKARTVNVEQLYAKRPNTIHTLQDDDICLQRSESVFDGGPWVEMLRDFNSTNSPEDTLLNKYNISWIQYNANQKKLIDQKVPFLAAIIVNITANSTLSSINLTLKDPTGEIDAAILHTLYADYMDCLTVGSVIVLRRFGVFSPGSNHYLTITVNNLVTIYSTDVRGDTETGSSRSKNMDGINKTTSIFRNEGNAAIKRIAVQKVTNEDFFKEANQATNQSLISSSAPEDLLHLNKPSTSAAHSKGENPADSSHSAFTIDGPCGTSNVKVSDFNKISLNTQSKHTRMVQQQTTTPAPLKEQTVNFDNIENYKTSILSLGSEYYITKNTINPNLFKHNRETVPTIWGVEQKKAFANARENGNVDRSKLKKNIFGGNDDLDDFIASQEFSSNMKVEMRSTLKKYIKNNRASTFQLGSKLSMDQENSNNMHFVMNTNNRTKENGQRNRASDFKAKISFEIEGDLDLAISQEFSTDMEVEMGSITKEYTKNNTGKNFELDDLNLSIDEEGSTNINFLTRTSSTITGALHNNRVSYLDIDDNKTRNFEGDSDLNLIISEQFNTDMEYEPKEGIKNNTSSIFELNNGTNRKFSRDTTDRATENIQKNTACCFQAGDDVDLSINGEFSTSMNFKTDIKTKGGTQNKRGYNYELVASNTEIRNTRPLLPTTSRPTRNIQNNISCFEANHDDVNCPINEDFSTSTNFEMDVKTKGRAHNKRASNYQLVTSRSETRNTIPLSNTTSRHTRNLQNNRASYFEADDNCSINEECNTADFEMDFKRRREIQHERGSNEELLFKSDIKDVIPLPNTSNNINIAIKMRGSKAKSKLMKYRFMSRNKYAMENEDENTDPKPTLAFAGREKEKCSKESSVIISSSQLSVKTTNIEHDEIWKSALGDIDTDSLFEDF